MSSCWLLCAFALASVLTPRGTVTVAWSELPSRISKLHAREWTGVKPRDVEVAVGLALSRRYPPTEPQSHDDCEASVFYDNDPSEPLHVTAEFEQKLVNGNCRTVLTNIAVRAHIPLADAEPLRSELVRALKAGGRPAGSVPDTEYAWRSVDSRTQYDLFVSVTPVSTPATPSTLSELKVIFSHSAVEPSEVDDLPFEKGFFPPDCRQ